MFLRFVYALFNFIVLPPGNLLLAALLAQGFRSRRGARNVTTLCIVLLYALSTPLVANGLIGLLETSPPLGAQPTGAQAIVVLSAEAGFAREYGHEVVGDLTMARLRYAADLSRRTGLPILATGGVYGTLTVPLAVDMAQTLEGEFGVHPVWIEPRAQDTWQNAMFSAPILAEHGVRTVFLVTSAFHMPRSIIAFEAAGIAVIPAPAAFLGRRAEWFDVLPQARSLQISYFALHELVGAVYYAFRRYLIA